VARRAVKLGLVTALTMARFPLVMLFFAGAIVYTKQPSTGLFVASILALSLSAVTDLFDGYLARRFGVCTEFGANADPLMDKFFYLASLPLLVFLATQNGNTEHAIILLAMTVCFLSRDQWVTFLRSIGSLYNVSGGAHFIGKLRTFINFPLIGLIYLFEESPVDFISTPVIYTCEGIALIINFISIYTYTKWYWPYLKKSASISETDSSENTAGDHDNATQGQPL
jgi:CDP-diacylglycerol--glycerol-3-phosphate 3-phosphatidyltransferase